MIDLILLGIINCLFIWGIHCSFSEGFVFEGLGKIIEMTIGTTLSKPLFLCPPCQSSFWGFIIFTAVNGFSFMVIPYVICLCGLNFIIKEYLYP